MADPPVPAGRRTRPYVTQTRGLLAERRDAVRSLHDRGVAAVQVCARLTAGVDEAISVLWRAALEDAEPAEAATLREGCVLIAHGGYGRRQLSPASDVDLMVLYAPRAKPEAERLAKRLTRDVFDVGLDLGHSLRTADEAIQMAREDAVVATTLIDSRPLIGSQELFEPFAESFRSMVARRKRSLSRLIVEARRAERERFGETVYLLEPNVKRSRGALRDVQLLRWLWFVQSGVADLDRLHASGVISKFDHARITSSRDFLLRVRNELHFGAQPPADTLHRAEQLRVAERMGYRGAPGLRPVEQFMRDYFRHAGHVWFLASRVAELTTARRQVRQVFEPVLGRAIEGDYRVGFTEIAATGVGLEKLRRRLDEALRLLDLARLNDRRVAQETWYAVYRSAPMYSGELSAEAAARFLSILENPAKLGQLLQRAHELGVLERVVPAMGQARCLLQFNQYHKFTVDEHCLRAVDMATRFAARDDLLGECYRRIRDKRLLHLALLLHDLGKGRDGDHSVIGAEIARDAARRLGLTGEETERLATLVLRHLDMSVLAFRRDTSSPEVVRRFAELGRSVDDLAMLFVLTCADMAAVGPGVLNDWKVSVLGDLYLRALERIGHEAPRAVPRREQVRDAVWAALTAEERRSDWFRDEFAALPESFVASRSPAAVAGALRRLRRVGQGDAPGGDPADSATVPGAEAWGGYLGDGSTLEMIAGVASGAGRGLFSGMAGALSGRGLRILSAETAILPDGLLLLRYTAEDPQPTPQANAAEANRRIGAIAASMVASIASDSRPTFPRLWGAERAAAHAALSGQPNEVRIDTAISDECAIVEVFTVDRVGLLYDLARSLHELGLVIRFAKIATSLDQVVDVFYVTERDGSKPADAARLEEVSRRLMAVIED